MDTIQYQEVDNLSCGRYATFHAAGHLSFEWTPVAEPTLYPRFVRRRLEEALEDIPVVLGHGPRQGGKTTLCRMVGDAACQRDDIETIVQRDVHDLACIS